METVSTEWKAKNLNLAQTRHYLWVHSNWQTCCRFAVIKLWSQFDPPSPPENKEVLKQIATFEQFSETSLSDFINESLTVMKHVQNKSAGNVASQAKLVSTLNLLSLDCAKLAPDDTGIVDFNRNTRFADWKRAHCELIVSALYDTLSYGAVQFASSHKR